MGNRNHNPRKCIQIILQDCQRLDIQVIGGLVQKNHIGRLHKDAQQIKPAFLTPGQLAYGRILDMGGK